MFVIYAQSSRAKKSDEKYSVELGFTWTFPVKQIETVNMKFKDLYRILVVLTDPSKLQTQENDWNLSKLQKINRDDLKLNWVFALIESCL